MHQTSSMVWSSSLKAIQQQPLLMYPPKWTSWYRTLKNYAGAMVNKIYTLEVAAYLIHITMIDYCQK